LNEILITAVRAIDLRLPTSRDNIGSDAVNTEPGYSAPYSTAPGYSIQIRKQSLMHFTCPTGKVWSEPS
jgi:hypothetical protein